MYSGEATVPQDILNVVLKAGEILQIKGLCREPEDEDPNKITKSSKSGQLPSTDTKTSETTSVVNKNPPPLIASR